MNKKLNIFVCLILSALSVFAIPYILKDDLGNHLYTNSILSVIIWVAIFFLLKYAFSLLDKRLMWISLVVGFLFSLFMVFGTAMYRYGETAFTGFNSWGRIFSITPFFFAIVAIILKTISNFSEQEENREQKSKILSNKKIFFIIWAIIFVAWIPYFLASYPGVFGYDSIHQANYYKIGVINLQHPMIHTYLLGFCVVTVGKLFGSNEAGMAFYSIVQMLCLSATFSTMYTFFIRKRLNVVLKTVIILWYMFYPVNPIMGFSSTKDVLFSAIFSLVFMYLLIIAETPDVLKSKRFCITFAITVFLMIAFRSQGIYIFILMMLAAFIILKQYRKSIIAITLSCIVIFAVYSGPVTSLLGGVKGNSLREMMSVPCVQLSRAMIENADELSAEEKQLIEEYVSGYYIYPVNSGISDYMKGSLDTERLKENPIEFAKLWLKVGLKCPGTYIDAFCRLTIGLWYPDMNYRDPLAYHPYWEYWSTGEWNGFGSNEFIQMQQEPIKGFEWLYELLSELSYENSYQEIPVISMLFSSGLAIWTVMLYTAYCIYKKLYRNFVPIVFVMALILTLLLGPVVLFRYVYPIIISIPVLIASVMQNKTIKVN